MEEGEGRGERKRERRGERDGEGVEEGRNHQMEVTLTLGLEVISLSLLPVLFLFLSPSILKRCTLLPLPPLVLGVADAVAEGRSRSP